MSELVRFGVSLEQDLLTAFDELSRRRGYANRSEALLHHCLEVMTLRGTGTQVRELADRLRSARGVLQGSLSLTPIQRDEASRDHHHHHGAPA